MVYDARPDILFRATVAGITILEYDVISVVHVSGDSGNHFSVPLCNLHRVKHSALVFSDEVLQIRIAAFGHSKAFELTEAGFQWLGDYEITADELLGVVTPKANKKERAKQLIYELAETNNVVKSEDIVNLAEEKGISKRTLENAKKEFGIKGKRIGESWYWNLDEIVKA